MKRHNDVVSLIGLFVLPVLWQSVFQTVLAFDISVYFDPISRIRSQTEQSCGECFLGDCQSGHEANYLQWLDSVANDTEAIRWWQEMGVNRLCVNYALSDFSLLPAGPDTAFKVINYRWPERMYQYLEAQAT